MDIKEGIGWSVLEESNNSIIESPYKYTSKGRAFQGLLSYIKSNLREGTIAPSDLIRIKIGTFRDNKDFGEPVVVGDLIYKFVED